MIRAVINHQRLAVLIDNLAIAKPLFERIGIRRDSRFQHLPRKRLRKRIFDRRHFGFEFVIDSRRRNTCRSRTLRAVQHLVFPPFDLTFKVLDSTGLFDILGLGFFECGGQLVTLGLCRAPMLSGFRKLLVDSVDVCLLFGDNVLGILQHIRKQGLFAFRFREVLHRFFQIVERLLI